MLSSLKLNNIQRLLFYFLILFIPVQYGRHFWPDFSFIKGVRVDYLSPTLHATDILIILIFILSVAKSQISNVKSQINSKFKILKITNYQLLITFVLFIVLGIAVSKSPTAGFYGLLKFLEFVFFGFYTAQNISKLKLQNILLMFSIGTIFESFLAIVQYFNHGSINGIFYFFGERFFTSLTPGIANASLGGELFLRPYGTFPHPNVLAGYLLIGMMLILGRIMNQESGIMKTIFILTLAIGTASLFLTLSRIAILLWLIILSFYFIRKFMIPHFVLQSRTSRGKHNSYFLIFLIVGFLFLGLTTPLGTRFTGLKLTDESIVQRENLIQSSTAMVKDHPLFGVGLNNFLINLPSYQTPHAPLFYLQPVHNIYLLILAQTGIVGLMFFVWFLIKTYRFINYKSYILILLTSVLTLGMFDHYFLTLQQGQLLFSFILGLCWSDSETSSE